jgi:hypothetical protein
MKQNALLSENVSIEIQVTEKKQLDWLATDTDDIATQSHSLFVCSQRKIAMWQPSSKM